MFRLLTNFLHRFFKRPAPAPSAAEAEKLREMEALLQPQSFDIAPQVLTSPELQTELQATQTDIGYFIGLPAESVSEQIALPLEKPQISREDFVLLMLEKAKEIKPEAVFGYDPNDYALKSQTEEQQVLYLHNAHLEYNRCSLEERPYILKKWLRHLLFLKQMPDEFEDVLPDLMPALRTKGYFELTQLRFQEQGRAMPYFPYQDVGERFGLTVAYDMHDSIVMISQKHLDDWNLSFYEAMEIAMRNLMEKGFTLTCLKLEEQMMVYIPMVGDSFDGTRLMLIEQISKLEVIGETVAIVLSTDTMMITGSEDHLGLSFFLTQAVECQEKPHAIPPTLLKLEGDEWVQWLPPVESEFHLPFKRFQIIAEGVDYAEQGTILRNLIQKKGHDIGVAHYYVAQQEATKQLFSYTIWNDEEKDTLLPKAEFIAFTIQGVETPVLIPWDVACETVGYLMALKYEYPPRYQVGVFPTSRELAEMQHRSEGKGPFQAKFTS